MWTVIVQWTADASAESRKETEVKEGERRQEHSTICTMQSQDASQRLRLDGSRWVNCMV